MTDVERFEAVSPKEAEARGAIIDAESTVNWNTCECVVENTPSGAVLVGHDGGEPEDQLLCRDWRWVVPALNEAYERGRAAILSELKAVIDEAGLRELEAKATIEPWEHSSAGLLVEGFELIPREVSTESGSTVAYCEYADAELVCALRNALPKLLALVPAEAGGKETT